MKMKMGVIKVMYDASTESLVIRRYHAKHSLTTANRDLIGSTLAIAAPAPAAGCLVVFSLCVVSFVSGYTGYEKRNDMDVAQGLAAAPVRAPSLSSNVVNIVYTSIFCFCDGLNPLPTPSLSPFSVFFFFPSPSANYWF